MIEPDKKLICQARSRLQEGIFAIDMAHDPETLRSKVIEVHDMLNTRAEEIVKEFLASQNY